jgi:hypothetical protein
LRAWLEDAAYEVVARQDGRAAPLLVGARRLLATPPDEPVTPRGSLRVGGVDRDHGPLLSCLVHALFRQLVHTGTIEDPLADALAAVAVSGRRRLAGQVGDLAAPERDTLAAVLGVHAANLIAAVPRLAPGWMPRTDDHVVFPLAGGRVVLHGTFDLLIGVPHPRTASTCALGLSTGGSWPRARRNLHYLALLETLRSGSPPFRLGLLDSSTGRSAVEDVQEDHLRAVTSHVAEWLRKEATTDA